MKGKNVLNNAGKAMGNAGKATLPKGEKLSDKIQQNKVNQGVNNTNKIQNQSSSQNPSGGNNSEEEKPKSKMEQAAGDVASEALKKGLKAAFPYIPQFIINKLVDSKLGQKLIERQLKETQRRIIFALIGVVATILMWLFLMAAMFALVVSPVAWLIDTWNTIKDTVISFGGFILGYGWCSSSDDCSEDWRSHYYNRINVEADYYKEECGVDLNRDLITATIFYDRMTSKESTDVEDGQFESETIEESTYYKYSQEDASHVIDLVNVYKNQSYKATCPIDIIEKGKQLVKDIVALSQGKFTKNDIDNIILEFNVVPTVADIEKKLGKLSEGETTVWNELLTLTKGMFSCFEGLMKELINSLPGFGENPCTFNEENYRHYLTSYYIPTNYNYLTGDKYGMTYEEIADDIFKMGEILGGGGLSVIEDTDGLFTMLPSGLDLGISSYPAHCRCHPVNHVYQSHKGVDIGGAPYGTEILAFADGVVTENVISTSKSCGSSIIALKHTNENGEVYYTRYVHLNRNSNNLLKNLKVGTNVVKGQVIGYVGGTVDEDSCSTGPHLHFEVHNSEGKVINAVLALNNVKNGIDILANQELIETCAYNGGTC